MEDEDGDEDNLVLSVYIWINVYRNDESTWNLIEIVFNEFLHTMCNHEMN